MPGQIRFLAFASLVSIALASCGTAGSSGGEADSGPSDMSAGPDAGAAMDDSGPSAAPERSPCDLVPGACEAPPPSVPTYEHGGSLVPSDQIPDTVSIGMSNNNLDVIWWQEALYFAFRTASHHHPRDDARIHVLSSTDFVQWNHEASFETGDDLREPNFFVDEGVLHLLYTAVEPATTNFVPIGPRLSSRDVSGQWSHPQPTLEEGLLIWRVKSLAEGLFATGYYGLGGILDLSDAEVWWLKKSADAWIPASGAPRPSVIDGGSTESDFVFMDDGSIVAVTRNDLGDEEGFGAKICRAPASRLDDWTCESDRRKYDSPLLFRHREEVYLVGRKNQTDSGFYDLGYSLLPRTVQLAAYMAAYWLAKKRCALWKVDSTTLAVEHILDVPSRGDTCFPEVVPLDEYRYLLFNYTSPIEGEDYSWREGQNNPTEITWGILSLPE